jgi:hypothetical protein
VGKDQFSEALQHAFAFARRLPRPDTAVECPACGGHGALDVRLVGRRNPRDYAAIDWRDVVERLAARGVDVAAIRRPGR